MNKNLLLKNLQLEISSVIVIFVGLAYGINPSKILPGLFGFDVNSLELQNIFRAIMGLYLSTGLFLLFGIKNSNYWRMATIISVIFTSGLAFGRIISTIFDGPSLLFSLALIAELALMIWGIVNLKNEKYMVKSENK